MSSVLKKAIGRMNAENGKDSVWTNGWNSEKGGG